MKQIISILVIITLFALSYCLTTLSIYCEYGSNLRLYYEVLAVTTFVAAIFISIAAIITFIFGQSNKK